MFGKPGSSSAIGYSFCVVAATLVLTLSPRAVSATAAGTVGGTVRDESGNAVAGVKVVLTEKAKGLAHSAETAGNGLFLFPSVLAGTYTVSAEKAGFRTYHVADLMVEVGETASIVITLTVGDLRTVVTVAAPSSTELEAGSNTLGAVIDSKRVRELPLNGRELLQLALLAGGADDVSAADNLSSANVGPPQRQIVLPGTFPNSTTYAMDGFNLSSSRDGEMAAGVSLGAIDQFKVQEGFLMPDQGSGVGIVNVITRTGSNKFHGEAYEYLRNRDLDARSFFAATSENLKRNQFGVSAGGPVWRDRLWFHTFYEGTRSQTAFQAAGYSPTAAMFTGDLAALGKPIYDPLSYDRSTGLRAPFPNAIIPAERISSVARNLLNFYIPGSSLSRVPSNVFGNPENTLTDNQWGTRLDLSLNQAHQLSFQFFDQSTPVNNPGLYPISGTLYRNGLSLAGLEHTWTMSPHAVNVLRAGFLRSIAIGGNEANMPLLSDVGITNTFGVEGISTINLQGYSSFGNSTGDVGNRDNTWQIDDGLTYAAGGHQIEFGAGFRYRRGWQQNSNRGALGALTFQPVFSAQLATNAQGLPAPVAGTGNSFADFLLGMPVSGTISGLPVVQYRSVEITPYVQDTWRVSRNVTLNYGVSWFLETPPDPQGWARSAVHGFDQQTGLLVFAGLGQLSPKVISTDHNNLAPRFGVAWQLRPDTVVRAGAGIYYSPMPWIVELTPLALGAPSSAGMGFTNSQTSPLPVYQFGRNIFPPTPTGQVTSAYAASLPSGTAVSALDPAFRTAYSSGWNVSIEHSLTRSDSLELSYLGSSGHRLPVITDLSQCKPTPSLFCSAVTKPWPNYSVVYWFTSSGNTSYDAFIARYAHLASHGLNLHLEYTLGKVLSDAWESSLFTRAQIANCRECDEGPTTFDVRSRAVGSVVWDIPYGQGRLTGGWSISAITTFATGQPVLFSSPNQTNTLYLDHLPNRVCDGRDSALSSSIRNNGFLWFDAGCFPVPPVGYFGNSGGTVVYGPGLNNWDLAVTKPVRLAEWISLVFRAEFFNSWNHAQFQQPDGNAGDGANFGRISAARTPRLIQFATKVVW
jgi:hypothetical protein